MRLLKIKDNSQLKKDNFFDIGILMSKIADKTLEQLEREGVFVFPEIVKDAEDITRDQMILQGINDTYRFGNVMGFLGCGDERLIIESRFCGENDDYFFRYLLDKVLDFPNIVDLLSEEYMGRYEAYEAEHGADGYGAFSAPESQERVENIGQMQNISHQVGRKTNQNQEERKMNITAKVTPLDREDGLKGLASVTIN